MKRNNFLRVSFSYRKKYWYRRNITLLPEIKTFSSKNIKKNRKKDKSMMYLVIKTVEKTNKNTALISRRLLDSLIKVRTQHICRTWNNDCTKHPQSQPWLRKATLDFKMRS